MHSRMQDRILGQILGQFLGRSAKAIGSGSSRAKLS